MKKQKSMLHDPLMIPRVKQYLEENVHQTYVDVAVMARALQTRYREYSRRKAAPFRTLVEQAYKMVLHSYGLDSNPSTDDNDPEGGNSDLEVMDDSSSNHLNDMLTNIYSKNQNKNNTNADSELIDIISSDESGDDDKPSSKDQQDKSSTTIEKAQINEVTVTKLSKVPPTTNNENAKRGVVASFPPLVSIDLPMKKRKLDQGESPKTGPPQLKSVVFSTVNNANPPANGENDKGVVFNALSALKIRKNKKIAIQIKQSSYTFRDIGGLDKILKDLCELLFHVKHPEIYLQVGISPPRGFLLHGPPGCGKTLLAQAIAGQLNIGIIEVAATELVSGVSGESEERIRDLFEQAIALGPCVLFIDEIDAITSNRINAQKDMERRIVSQLISSFDNLSRNPNGEQIVVIGATTNPDSLDPALRRVGRFDHEISIGIPDRDEREEILIVVTENLSVEVPFDFRIIAELTPGYVGADLVALATRAASLAIRRCFQRGHRLHQAKMSKNIPIVDLDADEGMGENDDKNTENDKTITETNESETAAKEIEKEMTTSKDSEEIEKVNGDVDVENKKGEDNGENEEGEDKEANEENEEGEDKEENEAVPEDSNEKEAQSDENKADEAAEENMDVDDGAEGEGIEQEANLLEEKKPEDDTPIDVDELPDAPPAASNQKPGRRQDLTLFEMMSWLSADSSPITDAQLDELFITVDDFKEAIKLVTPSAKREGFITVPDITWDDIGSLKDVREELKLAVLAPVKFPEKLKALGITTPAGVLLCGPPGCGKTLIAKAIANEAGINFISVKGPELMNMYVGESEKAVRKCFQRARNSAPCVIFFDEFDSLCPKRSDVTEGGSSTRVVNQLLTEMDGIEDRKGVFLMAASNRPDIIDPAVLRPGRLDKVIYIGLPQKQDRVEILDALTKKRTQPNLDDDVSFEKISLMTKGFTGADLAGLVRQASLLALKDSMEDPSMQPDEIKVNAAHFSKALKDLKPSVSPEEQKNYQKLRLKYTNKTQSDS